MLRIVIIALLLPVSAASAGYDKSWFVADYWSGEYPPGFAVTGDGVVLKARKVSDSKLKANIACPVPKNAVFHPWNEARPATYRTYAKIVTLKVLKNFAYDFISENGEFANTPVKTGDSLEYLVYGGEGYFQVRLNGKEMTAGQDLFEHVAPVEQSDFVSHEWVKIKCENGKEAWLLLSDLRKGDDGWLAGLDGPNITEYGKAADLAP